MKNDLLRYLSNRFSYTICLSMALSLTLTLTLTLSLTDLRAQICSNSADTIYGLTTAGQVVGINVLDGGAVNIGAPSAGASNTNGVGFNATNSSFYYFNISGGSAGSQQFVSYNPLTGIKTVLPSPPASVAAAHQIRSGCNTMAGTGYYMIDPLTLPHATLYYYNVTLATWTTITSSLTVGGVTDGTLDSLVSGDMAFDGSGNLWIVAASKFNWALYEIAAPVPTTVTASVPVIKQIPLTANPAVMFNNVSFTGVAFNSSGHLYLAAGNAAGGNRLYELTGLSAASLTLVHTIPADNGADLTSCSYPLVVLPVVWADLSAHVRNGLVDLDWTANEYGGVIDYEVQYSTDATHWQTIATVGANLSGGLPGGASSGSSAEQSYHYQTGQYSSGQNFYRIDQVSALGKENISPVKEIGGVGGRSVFIGPNPAKDLLYIYNKDNSTKWLAQCFDGSGRLALSTELGTTQQSIDVSRLASGVYLLRLVAPNNEPAITSRFIKR